MMRESKAGLEGGLQEAKRAQPESRDVGNVSPSECRVLGSIWQLAHIDRY